MGMMSLPIMMQRGYDPSLATGTIAATGTLGQIIPPSIALVLLGDVLSNAYQQAQLNMGIFAPKSVSVGDLFAGALLPGLVLVVLYLLYLVMRSFTSPTLCHSGLELRQFLYARRWVRCYRLWCLWLWSLAQSSQATPPPPKLPA
ncbi:MAG: hypothetical protein CM15mP120_08070 [Pseudomonadota bacterium]|nr:MAG: hypothetical protein CM15mP120_08070 [Pseudomonadota bacterium]